MWRRKGGLISGVIGYWKQHRENIKIGSDKGCGQNLQKNDSRHSTVSIYTTEIGVKECYNFNGNSSVCKSTHYYRLATTLQRRQRLEYGGKRDFSIGSECLLWAKSQHY